ncbi:hypothetical protein GCM10023084_62050 [Streptomyces lacrimifluminis]|uniref:Uncharacterized protein n=1 Tax=Streptomyces lacrimifluminis TaxID=1500077 RepID=A0A917NZR8_9ACTN|nr:hypothetical protein GCM10012282_46890 [Streptomyces lacrimifluminis]
MLRVEPGQRHHAGVVHERVDPSVLGDGVVDGRAHVVGTGHVEPTMACPAALRTDAGGQCLQAVRPSCADDDPVAFGGEPEGGGRTDAAAGTGHEDHPGGGGGFGER